MLKFILSAVCALVSTAALAQTAPVNSQCKGAWGVLQEQRFTKATAAQEHCNLYAKFNADADKIGPWTAECMPIVSAGVAGCPETGGFACMRAALGGPVKAQIEQMSKRHQANCKI